MLDEFFDFFRKPRPPRGFKAGDVVVIESATPLSVDNVQRLQRDFGAIYDRTGVAFVILQAGMKVSAAHGPGGAIQVTHDEW